MASHFVSYPNYGFSRTGMVFYSSPPPPQSSGTVLSTPSAVNKYFLVDWFVSACGDGWAMQFEEEWQKIEEVPTEGLVTEVRISV